MGRWIGILLAETGSSTDPGALHYDYIDVEMTASVIQAAKQTFWWEAFSYPAVSSALRIYIHILTPLPAQLIKIRLPLCQILNSWSVSALQHVRCVHGYCAGILLSSVKCARHYATLLKYLPIFSVSPHTKCYILIFYFAQSLRTIPGREQIFWNMQLCNSHLLAAFAVHYRETYSILLINIYCTLTVYSKYKSCIDT